METMKGAAQNGDHEGRQMKGRGSQDQNGDDEGRQGGSGSQEQPRMEIMKEAAQNGDREGEIMKGDKAAAAAKSSPDWRSRREQHRMEITKGDKAAAAAKSRIEIMKGDK